MNCLIVIPARMGATRFPGKPLVDINGKPMVQWVYEAAQASGVGDQVVVATPDEEIIQRVQGFGGEAILTGHYHQTGTDRIAEVAQAIKADVYVNVQGDEPLIQSSSIAACAKPMLANADIQMASIYSECPELEYDDPSVVKVVLDNEGYALCFSRYAIPFPRNPRVIPVNKHVGLYGYRGDILERFSGWPMGNLERAESLEQLRFMENGVRIFMAPGAGTELAVDTPEQADAVRAILAERT